MGFFDDLNKFKQFRLGKPDPQFQVRNPFEFQQIKDNGLGNFKPLKFSGKVLDRPFNQPIKFFSSFDINRVFRRK